MNSGRHLFSPRPHSQAGLSLMFLCFLAADSPAHGGERTDAGPSAAASGVSLDEVDKAPTSARTAFKQGTALAHEGQWIDALAAFERSAELRPHAVTTYNVAFCERALGRYARARNMFGNALTEHKVRGGVELPENLLAAADDYLAELEGKVARLNVNLVPGDAALSVDGAPVEMVISDGGRPGFAAGTRNAGPPEVVGSGSFELLFDPRLHKFVVSRVGYSIGYFERTVEVGGRGELDLRLDQMPSTSRVPLELPAHANHAPAYVAFGVGSVGVAVGVVAGLVALSKSQQLSDLCREKQCYPGEGRSTLEPAQRAADISTIGFFVAAGGAAAGAAFWWLLGPSKSESKTSQPSHGVSASIGLRSIALANQF